MSEKDWKVPDELLPQISLGKPYSSNSGPPKKAVIKSPQQYYQEETQKRIGRKNTLRDRGVDTESEAWRAAKQAMDASDVKRKTVHAARRHKLKDLTIEEDVDDS